MWIIISPWLLGAAVAGLVLQIVENITLCMTGIPEEEAEDERIHKRSRKAGYFKK